MKPTCNANACLDCEDRIVCRCLRVTESALVGAVTRLELRTITDIPQHTGAGDGCTCCHHLLKRYLKETA